MKIGKTYHDVTVFVDETKIPFSTCNFAYQLRLHRVSGWELWWKWGTEEKKVGSEYGYCCFRIEVNGITICENKYSKKLRKKLKGVSDIDKIKKIKEKFYMILSVKKGKIK